LGFLLGKWLVIMSECHDHDDPGLLRRIRNVSAINFLIGTTELAAGVITNSSTLTMAGVHDATDGELYRIKRKAAAEQDPGRKRTLRRRGAIALMGAAVTLGTYELASNAFMDNHKPESAAATVGVVAAGANIAAAFTLHGKRHHHDAHDSWRHITEVDLPGSLVTLIAAPLSIRYPLVDAIGASAHIALAIRVGVDTLRQSNESFESDVK
jgi:Co/Zn/Cd efflux system component